jgi:hypothetical protein
MAKFSPESNPQFMFCSDIYKVTEQPSDPKHGSDLLKIANKTIYKI